MGIYDIEVKVGDIAVDQYNTDSASLGYSWHGDNGGLVIARCMNVLKIEYEVHDLNPDGTVSDTVKTVSATAATDLLPVIDLYDSVQGSVVVTGSSATVTLQGEVTDFVGDTFDAPLTQKLRHLKATVGDETFDLTLQDAGEAESFLKPFPCKATFDQQISFHLQEGPNVIALECENSLGLKGHAYVSLVFDAASNRPSVVPVVPGVPDSYLLNIHIPGAFIDGQEDSMDVFEGDVTDPPPDSAVPEVDEANMVFEGYVPDVGQVRLQFTEAPVLTAQQDTIKVKIATYVLWLWDVELELTEYGDPQSNLFRITVLTPGAGGQGIPAVGAGAQLQTVHILDGPEGDGRGLAIKITDPTLTAERLQEARVRIGATEFEVVEHQGAYYCKVPVFVAADLTQEPPADNVFVIESETPEPAVVEYNGARSQLELVVPRLACTNTRNGDTGLAFYSPANLEFVYEGPDRDDVEWHVETTAGTDFTLTSDNPQATWSLAQGEAGLATTRAKIQDVSYSLWRYGIQPIASQLATAAPHIGVDYHNPNIALERDYNPEIKLPVEQFPDWSGGWIYVVEYAGQTKVVRPVVWKVQNEVLDLGTDQNPKLRDPTLLESRIVHVYRACRFMAFKDKKDSQAFIAAAMAGNFRGALDMLPVTGTVKGAIEAITGEDPITGRPLSKFERAMAITATVACFVAVFKYADEAGSVLRKSDDAIQEAAKFIDEGADAAERLVRTRLLRKLKGFDQAAGDLMKHGDDVKQFLGITGETADVLVKHRGQWRIIETSTTAGAELATKIGQLRNTSRALTAAVPQAKIARMAVAVDPSILSKPFQLGDDLVAFMARGEDLGVLNVVQELPDGTLRKVGPYLVDGVHRVFAWLQ